jgi:SOS-response transcriptional repressor LexA
VGNFETGVKTEWHDTTNSGQSTLRALRILDDSMTPVFQPGTTLIIDPEKNPKSGNFAFVRIANSEEKCGQLVCENGINYVKPANIRYQAIPLTADSVISGTVIRAVIDLLD